MKFLESEKEFAGQLDGILSTWDSTQEIKEAKEKCLISYEQQDPGTLLIKIGFDEYIIDFNIVYRESPSLTSSYNEGYVEISFFKLNRNRLEVISDYIEIGKRIILGRNGKLYDESNKKLFHQFDLKTPQGIFMVLMERIIMEKEFTRG
jgi:hypothetical protein